jgi:hypothetical protein
MPHQLDVRRLVREQSILENHSRSFDWWQVHSSQWGWWHWPCKSINTILLCLMRCRAPTISLYFTWVRLQQENKGHNGNLYLLTTYFMSDLMLSVFFFALSSLILTASVVHEIITFNPADGDIGACRSHFPSSWQSVSWCSYQGWDVFQSEGCAPLWVMIPSSWVMVRCQKISEFLASRKE